MGNSTSRTIGPLTLTRVNDRKDFIIATYGSRHVVLHTEFSRTRFTWGNCEYYYVNGEHKQLINMINYQYRPEGVSIGVSFPVYETTKPQTTSLLLCTALLYPDGACELTGTTLTDYPKTFDEHPGLNNARLTRFFDKYGSESVKMPAIIK